MKHFSLPSWTNLLEKVKQRRSFGSLTPNFPKSTEAEEHPKASDIPAIGPVERAHWPGTKLPEFKIPQIPPIPPFPLPPVLGFPQIGNELPKEKGTKMNALDKGLAVVRSEPVRVILYPLLIALVAYLGISDGAEELILAVVAAVLGIPAVEAARSKVTPEVK